VIVIALRETGPGYGKKLAGRGASFHEWWLQRYASRPQATEGKVVTWRTRLAGILRLLWSLHPRSPKHPSRCEDKLAPTVW
jgi:hypothetical protein